MKNLTHPNTIFFTLGFIFFLLICSLHLSCGVKASGGTTHKVEGEAVIRVEFDFSVCNDLPEDVKRECVMTLISILKKRDSET